MVQRVVSRRIASRQRKWCSWLNGNSRWFVRQSSFSGFARRSFSRQLRGEKEIGEKGHLLFASLPTRLCFPSALLYLLYLRFSLFLPHSFSLYFRLPARSAATRHMDAHEERLLHCTRKRPRESSSRFASLVKRMRDFAYRTLSHCLSLSFSFPRCYHPLVSSLTLCLARLLLLFLSSFSIF